MTQILLNIIGPVAIIVAFGYVATFFKIISIEQIRALTLFAQNFAVPILLFDATRQLQISDGIPLDLLATYYVPALTIFALSFLVARWIGRGPQASVVMGFNGYFANSVYLGLPLCLLAYGEASLSTNYLILAFHSPIGYICGAISIELARPEKIGWQKTFFNIAKDITTNPLIFSICLGAIVNFFNIPFPKFINEAINLISPAALPVAIFALGGVLTSLHLRGTINLMLSISIMRLIIHPALVLLLGMVLRIDEPILLTLVIISALPTGINGFIFAGIYKREEETAASIVFFSTLVSIASLPIWFLIIERVLG